MRKLFLLVFLLLSIAPKASAVEITAPEVPAAARTYMPRDASDFSAGLRELVWNVASELRPELRSAAGSALGVFAGVLAVSILQCTGDKEKPASRMVMTMAISSALLGTADTMIRLGGDTILQLNDYGKLLFPVMTAALAAQGRVSSSAALYAGTAFFNMVITGLIVSLLLPLVYVFLALAVANSALGEGILKKMRDLVKSFTAWCLKTVLIVFTTYMSITGAVSGTTDAAALKAAKVTISSVVPVVGGILADASESVLVGAGVMKNAAGVYGILAMLAVFLAPFLRLGIQYIILKATSAVCSICAPATGSELIEDFASAMGLLLAMTGAGLVILLVSTVCFMKGVG